MLFLPTIFFHFSIFGHNNQHCYNYSTLSNIFLPLHYVTFSCYYVTISYEINRGKINLKTFDLILTNKHFTDLNPLLFGYLECNSEKYIAESKRSYCLLQYVISGKGKLNLNDVCHDVSAHQLFIVPIGVKNSYYTSNNDPWKVFWFGFDGKLAQQFSQLPPVIDVPPHFFQDMLEVRQLKTMQAEFLLEKLLALYRFLFADTNNENYISSIQDYINANYNADISVNSIAANLNLNRSYISRLFKKKTEITIQEYIINTRMKHAHLLLKSGTSVQSTAQQVGYPDVYNFSKIFKKIHGVSPSQIKTKGK